MVDGESTASRYRFGVFEISLRTGELRKDGLRIKLQEKPFQVLALLVERAGQTVSREQFRNRLWLAETTVDFDSNLNTALTKVRQALDESAENPRFVETVPRLGYRFLAPVERLEDPQEPPSERAVPMPGERALASGQPLDVPSAGVESRAWWRWALSVVLLLMAVAAGGFYLLRNFSSRFMAASTGKTVLVVLPFANLSNDPKEEYFSDGLTDELITQIGGLNPEKLTVIARTSAMHYKGTQKTVEQIGRELGADYALEGSVRHGNGRVVVTAELVQTRSQTGIWGHSFESNTADVLQIQSDVAKNVASALTLELMPRTPSAAGTARRPVNEEVYETYLEGRLYWNKRSKDSLRKAEKLFAETVQKDPQFELGYAGLAETYLTFAGWGVENPMDSYSRARGAAQKALALNDSLGSAHAVLGVIAWHSDRDWTRAESEFRRAIELDPASATSRQWYAAFLCSLGRHAEAMEQIQSARQIDPISLSAMSSLGNILYNSRRYAEAIEASKQVIKTDPTFPPAYRYLARSNLAVGNFDEAEQAELKYMELNGESDPDREAFRRAYQAGGMKAAWRWKLKAMEQKKPHEYVSPFEEALVLTYLGQPGAALTFLEKAFETGDSGLAWIKVIPALDPLRGDPRFKSLLSRMHLDS